MSEVEKITTLSLGLVGVILFVWWLVRHQKKTEKMRSARIGIEVERLGLSFQGGSDPSAGELLAPHPLGKWGSAKGARSVARGSFRGHPLVAFEFSYVVSTGKSSHTVRQTVVILQNSKRLPDLELCAEGVLDRFKEYFGAQDFDFSAHPAFSKKYRLRGTDEDFETVSRPASARSNALRSPGATFPRPLLTTAEVRQGAGPVRGVSAASRGNPGTPQQIVVIPWPHPTWHRVVPW